MAGFQSSSSKYKSQVDQILEEAMDHYTLEQISAINLSSFTPSVLPSDIENRFQRLKTLPSSSSLHTENHFRKVKSLPSSSLSSSTPKGNLVNSPLGKLKASNFSRGNSVGGEGKTVISPLVQSKVPNFEGSSVGGKGMSVISQHGQSKVSNFEENSEQRKGKMVISEHGQLKASNFGGNSVSVEGKLVNSQTGSVDELLDSDEEMGRNNGGGGGGCLCFPSKRVSRRTKSGCETGRNANVVKQLSVSRTISSKETRNMKKQAVEREKSISKEAVKVVKWAKQVSSRIDDITEIDNE